MHVHSLRGLHFAACTSTERQRSPTAGAREVQVLAVRILRHSQPTKGHSKDSGNFQQPTKSKLCIYNVSPLIIRGTT